MNIEKIEQYLPFILKYGNRAAVLMWKLGMGKLLNAWPAVLGKTMVVKHTDRLSGKELYTPVNYIEENSTIYCASFIDRYNDWMVDLVSNPQIEIWVPDGWFSAEAEIVEDSGERVSKLKAVLNASGFAAPIMGVYPKSMDGFEFEQVAESFRLARIQRQSARTGPEGPGSLSWVWPILLLVVLIKKKNR